MVWYASTTPGNAVGPAFWLAPIVRKRSRGPRPASGPALVPVFESSWPQQSNPAPTHGQPSAARVPPRMATDISVTTGCRSASLGPARRQLATRPRGHAVDCGPAPLRPGTREPVRGHLARQTGKLAPRAARLASGVSVAYITPTAVITEVAHNRYRLRTPLPQPPLDGSPVALVRCAGAPLPLYPLAC